MVKYNYSILYVADVAKTISFYESAFGFVKKFCTPENDYGELITGDTTISFASHELANSNLQAGFKKSTLGDKPFGIELGFVTENVEESLKMALSAGAILVENIKVKPWGQKVAYVTDINGFLIELCSPMQG